MVRVSVREHAAILREKLIRLRTATFRALCADCETTLEVVARFLALLELYREGLVAFDQMTGAGRADRAAGPATTAASLELAIDEYGDETGGRAGAGGADGGGGHRGATSSTRRSSGSWRRAAAARQRRWGFRRGRGGMTVSTPRSRTRATAAEASREASRRPSRPEAAGADRRRRSRSFASWVPPWAPVAAGAGGRAGRPTTSPRGARRSGGWPTATRTELPDPDDFEPGLADDTLRGAVEAILFVVDEPVTTMLLAQVLEEPTTGSRRR